MTTTPNTTTPQPQIDPIDVLKRFLAVAPNFGSDGDALTEIMHDAGTAVMQAATRVSLIESAHMHMENSPAGDLHACRARAILRQISPGFFPPGTESPVHVPSLIREARDLVSDIGAVEDFPADADVNGKVCRALDCLDDALRYSPASETEILELRACIEDVLNADGDLDVMDFARYRAALNPAPNSRPVTGTEIGDSAESDLDIDHIPDSPLDQLSDPWHIDRDGEIRDENGCRVTARQLLAVKIKFDNLYGMTALNMVNSEWVAQSLVNNPGALAARLNGASVRSQQMIDDCRTLDALTDGGAL